MLATGILVAVFAFVMILTAIFGGQKSTTEIALTSVSARNSEVLRLIDELEPELSSAQGKSYATQAKILLTSDNLTIVDYTNRAFSSSYSSEQVANADVSATIAELSDRIGQNNFDEVFISSVQFELNLNKVLLEQLNPETQSEALSAIIQTIISNYTSLL